MSPRPSPSVSRRHRAGPHVPARPVAALALAVAVLAGCAGALPDPAQVAGADPQQLAALEADLRARLEAERDPDVLHRLALVRMRQGDADQALLLAQEASRRAPFRADLLHALGDVYATRGERFRAMLSYAQAVEADSERLESYVALARMQHALRRPEPTREGGAPQGVPDGARPRQPAAETLAQAIHLEPLFFEARLALATVLLETGDPEAAEPEIQVALRVRPRGDAALHTQVRILEALGRLAEARRVAETALERKPEDAGWLAAVLRVRHRQRDWPAVAALWPRMVQPGPEQLLIRADQLAAQGDVQAAGELRAELAAAYPRHPAVLVAAGRGLLAEGDATAALEMLETASQTDPTDAEAHYWRAVAHFRLDRTLEGDLALNRAESLAPTHPDVMRLRVRRLLATGAIDAASRKMAEILARAPDDPRVLLLRAEVLTLAGDPAGATRLLEALPDGQPGVRYARARLFYLQGRYRTAADEAAALAGSPEPTWEARYLEAAALGRLGDFAAARERIAPLLAPDAAPAPLYRLDGDLHDRAGDAEAAAAAYRRGLRHYARNADLIEGFTRIAVAGEQWREARSWLEVGVEQPGPHRPVLLLRLARTYAALGEPARAAAVRQRYLDAVDPLLREPRRDGPSAVLFAMPRAARVAVAEGR